MRSVLLISIFAILLFSTTVSAMDAGIHLLISVPLEEMAEVSKTGMGLGGKFFHSFESLPWLSLRGDLAYLSYDSKQQLVYFAGYLTYQTTRTEGFQLSLGPQFKYESGSFQTYFSPMIGFQYFQTVISLPEAAYYGYYATDTRDTYGVLGWSVSSGVLFDIGLGPWIDVGLKYNYLYDGVRQKVDEVTTKSDGSDLTITLGVVFFREVQ